MAHGRARLNLFVATDGTDSWTGQVPEPSADGSDGPFATLGRALEVAMDARAAGLAHRVRIVIRGGRYYLSETVVAALVEHACGASAPIACESFAGEEAIFSAGRDIPGWRQRQEWYLRLYLPPSVS